MAFGYVVTAMTVARKLNTDEARAMALNMMGFAFLTYERD
jgi:hypothetical protein